MVQVLLESGALCERDTFQGERCLYNALNNRIRNLLLAYDYSKSIDPLQPLASHITSLLTRDHPKTSDMVVLSTNRSFNLHKFILSARSPYFREKLSHAPDTTFWKLPSTIPPQAFEVAMRYLYLGEIPNDVGGGPGTGYTEEEILEGIDKISKQLEVRSLWDGILESSDRRLSRQNRTEEMERGRNQLDIWFAQNVVQHKITIESSKAVGIRWDRDNAIFADVLLQADHPQEEDSTDSNGTASPITEGIPVGPLLARRSQSGSCRPRLSTLFPAHRAMLLRSEYFQTMFSSSFLEAQVTPHLQVIPISCSPEVLEIVLAYLYTERADFPLDIAADVLYAADLLFIDKLKVKAAVVISTLGSGAMTTLPSRPDTQVVSTGSQEREPVDIYEIIRAGWLTRVPRLEEFAARYIAYRLERYIGEEEFADLIRESAARIKGRQETDSIELLDDIRYYLSERFRLRFEDVGFEEMADENRETTTDVNVLTTWSNNIDHKAHGDEGVDFNTALDENIGNVNGATADLEAQLWNGAVRTLDGELAGDEFAGDAINYQILLGKIDALLDRLKLDA